MVDYRVLERLDADEFIDLLTRCSLGHRRPIQDRNRIARMIAGASLVVGAFDEATDRLIGIARSLTDFSYCCYISDLAVDEAFQGKGIGRRLIEITREAAGLQAMCLLVASPDAQPFYEAIGMPRTDLAFLYPRRE